MAMTSLGCSVIYSWWTTRRGIKDERENGGYIMKTSSMSGALMMRKEADSPSGDGMGWLTRSGRGLMRRYEHDWQTRRCSEACLPVFV